jgi:hypothetical protein
VLTVSFLVKLAAVWGLHLLGGVWIGIFGQTFGQAKFNLKLDYLCGVHVWIFSPLERSCLIKVFFIRSRVNGVRLSQKHHRMFSGSVLLRKKSGKLAQFLSQVLAVKICLFGILLLTVLMYLKFPILQFCLLLPGRFGMPEIGFYGIIRSARWMMFGGKWQAWLPIPGCWFEGAGFGKSFGSPSC